MSKAGPADLLRFPLRSWSTSLCLSATQKGSRVATNVILNLLPHVRVTVRIYSPTSCRLEEGCRDFSAPRSPSPCEHHEQHTHAGSCCFQFPGNQGQERVTVGETSSCGLLHVLPGQEPSQKRCLGRSMTSFHGKFPPVFSI